MPVSIDTAKAAVAERALAAGATMVNDVTAMRADPDMAGVVAAAGAAVCLMHMQGTPRTMQDDPRYDDVVAEIVEFLARAGGARRSRRASTSGGSASTRGSASARPSITTCGFCRSWMRCVCWAAPSWSASRASGSWVR